MRFSEPEYAEITPELAERIERFREEHAGDPVGDVANTILFEDECVRIWEMKLEPGEHSALHRHDHDYYLAIWSGDYVAAVTPKDSPVDSFVCKLPPEGNTVSIPKGGVEWAYNVGQKTYREVLFELKDT